SNPHSEISSAPNEQVVTILERLDDPQDFMTALVTANSSGSLSSLALEQKAAIIKHALAIDPFQEYMRDLTEATDARPLLDIIRENGPLLLSEELENGHCEIFISDDLSTVLVDRSNQKIEILPTVVTESGALTFSSMNARGKTEIVGSVSANKHGLVISLTLPGEAPARGEYWRGKELSHYPYSIMPDVERILGLE
ncbi:MAG: hypothetical protein J0M12_10540, partial [Deltaproteobacteria bacterium]|nr:hypothetical protein [Deltaproteobacteria bacterium]